MNPDPNSTPEMSVEEFLNKVQKTQGIIRARREKAWQKTVPDVERLLADNNLPTSPAAREMFMTLCQIMWMKGYADGTEGATSFLLEQAGFVKPANSLSDQLNQQKPENN